MKRLMQFAGHSFAWNVIRPGDTLASGTAAGTSAAAPNSTGGTSNYSY